MPKMVVSIDGVVIKEVMLAKERTSLGRRPYNDIVIDNLAISGEHAVLHMSRGQVYLEDLGSTNGTYVNSRPIRKQALQHNDVIEVGKYKIRYLDKGPMTADPALREPRADAALAPIAFSGLPTAPAMLEGARLSVSVIRVLSGQGAGRDIGLNKVVTTIGKPGLAVAAVTRRLRGFVVSPVDGATLLNGEPLGQDAVPLRDGDLLEVAGTRMQFVQG